MIKYLMNSFWFIPLTCSVTLVAVVIVFFMAITGVFVRELSPREINHLKQECLDWELTPRISMQYRLYFKSRVIGVYCD